jgi:hypothetical protein
MQMTVPQCAGNCDKMKELRVLPNAVTHTNPRRASYHETVTFRAQANLVTALATLRLTPLYQFLLTGALPVDTASAAIPHLTPASWPHVLPSSRPSCLAFSTLC